jgi:hypothetical protein
MTVPSGISVVAKTVGSSVGVCGVPEPERPPLPRISTIPTNVTTARKTPMSRINRLLRFK